MQVVILIAVILFQKCAYSVHCYVNRQCIEDHIRICLLISTMWHIKMILTLNQRSMYRLSVLQDNYSPNCQTSEHNSLTRPRKIVQAFTKSLEHALNHSSVTHLGSIVFKSRTISFLLFSNQQSIVLQSSNNQFSVVFQSSNNQLPIVFQSSIQQINNCS